MENNINETKDGGVKEVDSEADCSATSYSALRVLRLTLKRQWFDMIASGEKLEEYREIKDWVISRLNGKTYDVVEFSNGYGKHVPKVTVEYLGWGNGIGRSEWGAPRTPVIIIRLGPVLSLQNGIAQSPTRLSKHNKRHGR